MSKSGSKSRIGVVSLTLVVTMLALGIFGACASSPGTYQKANIRKPFKSAPAEPQIVRGRKNFLLDGLGHYCFSLVTKLILWNWSVDNHRISEENEEILHQYLAVNGLTTTQVRLNSYAPHKEFARLKKNKDVGAFYKYIFGTISVLRYTLIPDRLFAGLPSVGVGDSYNPFTNTIHIYSNHPAILVHEGGHSKDFAQRQLRGTYAIARIIPFVDLYQEYLPSEDAVNYFYCRRDEEDELNAYPILEPAYATYVSGYLPWGGFGLPIVLAHIHGRMKRTDRRHALELPEYGNFRGTCWAEGETPPGAASSAATGQPSPAPSSSGDSQPVGGVHDDTGQPAGETR
jgi:hypothetical protein